MKKSILLLVIILLPALLFYWRDIPAEVRGPSSDYSFEYIVKVSGTDNAEGVLPMVIALHGQGDSAENFFQTLLGRFKHPARFIVIRGPFEFGGANSQRREWPMDAGGIKTYGDALSGAVSVLMQKYPTRGKPVVVGFSSGAMMSYYLASKHAGRFSFIFPLSGHLPGQLMTPEKAPGKEGAKIIAMHATDDSVISYQAGLDAVRYLRSIGISAEWVSFRGEHLAVFRSANQVFLRNLRMAVKEADSLQ